MSTKRIHERLKVWMGASRCHHLSQGRPVWSSPAASGTSAYTPVLAADPRQLFLFGRDDNALAYAEATEGRRSYEGGIAALCERLLIEAGRSEEAFERYGMAASYGTTHIAQFRGVCRKYPDLAPARILHHMLAATPEPERGKWFTAAMSLPDLEMAQMLAEQGYTNPVTLTRAAKKWLALAPSFALAVSVAALKHICAGRIYEIEFGDVLNAFECVQEAGRALGLDAEVAERLRAIVASDVTPGKFVRDWLGRRVGLGQQNRSGG